MGEVVKRHSVFLRKECQMPAHFDLAQQPCADSWMLLEEIEAPVLDTMIRHAGWHFDENQTRSMARRTLVARSRQ